MATGRTIYKEIFKQYDRIRTEEAAAQKKRREEVYAKAPRTFEIDKALNLLGIKIAKMALKKEQDTGMLLEELRRETKALQKERETLLFQNGFAPEYLALRYQCEKCQDTGYIGTEKCACLTQHFIDEAYGQSNLRDICKVENFDFFDFRYYSEETDAEHGVSPLANIKTVFTSCLRFVEHFEDHPENLLLYGSTGLGKTFLCNCIAKEILDQGHTVLYQTAAGLFHRLEEEKFSRREEQAEGSIMDDVLDAELLIIDDLGTEFSTVLSSSALFTMLNGRILTKKPTILSTNLKPKEMISQYSDRIVSRMTGEYRMLKFFGADIRKKKKFEKRGRTCG